MIRTELNDLIARQPFEPFRIVLVSGNGFDVFYATSIAVQRLTVFLSPPDGTWAVFPLDKICSVESTDLRLPGTDCRA